MSGLVADKSDMWYLLEATETAGELEVTLPAYVIVHEALLVW